MNPLILLALLLLAYMTAAFVISLLVKDNGVADIAYGLGFVVLAWKSYALGLGGTAGLIASVLVTVWGVRLARRIHRRNHGRPEDFRYRAWREAWGSWFVARSYVQIYLLQGSIIFLIALPVVLLNLYGATTIGWLGLLGILVWVKGFFYEAVGDYQLDRFLKNPENKGHIMAQGLWRYTRHPNYYGESLMWWGIGLLAASVLVPLYGWVWFFVFESPLLITFLLLKVSGVPMLEAHFSGPEWEAYKARTSIFIPWFPKRPNV